MVYGAEAVLPLDINYDSLRNIHYAEEEFEISRQDAVDQLDEHHDLALSRSVRYQQTLRRYHSRGIRPRTLQVGDLVLRRVQSSKGRHKLSRAWEGPFSIYKVLCLGTYWLKDFEGRTIDNPWNIENLRRFYA
jgi:hypothetical protein